MKVKVKVKVKVKNTMRAMAPTLMTKEEFFARIDEAKKGTSMRFNSVEELDKYIRSL